MSESISNVALPGQNLQVEKMPGHWLLARLGKRVLRPGGLGLTRKLLSAVNIHANDEVVEFAPGLGGTARMIIEQGPGSYTGVERDQEAADWASKHLPDKDNTRVVVGAADNTGLPDASASIVMGEAMLTMNTPKQKQQIVAEAFRVLREGGRYGIHEMCLVPDAVSDTVKSEIQSALSRAIHVGARPLTVAEWRALMESAGFRVESVQYAPMYLLRPTRLFADEGFWRALKFIRNVATDADARKRVLTMRRTFLNYQSSLGAIALVAVKDV